MMGRIRPDFTDATWEAFRAVPLVTLLFLGQYMIGFLFPNTFYGQSSFLTVKVIDNGLFIPPVRS